MICASSRVTMPRMARRVVCGFVEVIATFSPTSALVSVDLPTFGRPTRATQPERCVSVPLPASAACVGAGAAVPGSCSAVIVVLLVAVRRVLVRRGAAHQDGGQSLAAAGALLGLQLEAVGDRVGAGERHAAGQPGQAPRGGCDGGVVRREAG